jgi:predicted TIM-barrel fold metal-dependent hydrolase
MIRRRELIKRASMAVVASAAPWLPVRAAGSPYPNSAGTDLPRLKAPPNACDCHIHIFDPRFAGPDGKPVSEPAQATVKDYRQIQQRLGTSRVVVVMPRPYGTDPAMLLDAMKQLGRNGRGIAVLHPAVTDAELKRLNDAGVRGVRFSLGGPKAQVVSFEEVKPMAERAAGLGWHLQFNLDPEQIVQHADLLMDLPTPLVFDHLGHPNGVKDPAFAVLRRLLDQGRTWIKLSGAYLNSDIGAPDYPEATQIAQAFVQAAPERLVWGSDWPHTGPPVKPDDALLFDLLRAWAPAEATRHRILVSNPEALYGFARPG